MAKERGFDYLIIECFHSRGQHLNKFIGTKESVCIRKEFNSHRTGLGHQHGRRFIVLGHQYGRRDVMWKHSIDLSACIPLQWANIKKWGRGSGGQFHTNHYILSTRASTWYLRLQGCMREISIAGENVPSTTLFHQIHVIWCRKHNWPVLKIVRNPVRNKRCPHCPQQTLIFSYPDLTLSWPWRSGYHVLIFTSSNFCGCCCCLLVFCCYLSFTSMWVAMSCLFQFLFSLFSPFSEFCK